MNEDSMYWMNYSVEIANKGSPSILRTGVVLTSKDNKLICSAYSEKEPNASWGSALLHRIRKVNVFDAQSIFLTINTLSTLSDHSFELVELLKEIHINNIYIGLPDPILTSYLDTDPVIIHDHVYRYPDILQRKIIEQNNLFFADSKQNIKYCPYYRENRISNLVIEKLKSRGFLVSAEELNANKQSVALSSLICKRYGLEYSEASGAVFNAISEAFNDKYTAYNYSNDTRSVELTWKEKFMSFYRKSSAVPLASNSILNVGVGSGQEACALFSNCTCVTFVDIARNGLDKITKEIPKSKFIVSSADDLSLIPDSSYDLYVSLRTYNSSFFNIKEAISEARRVLKPNALIIISVANGFLCSERHSIIPGLIIPGTDFVDIYRGMDTAKLIRKELVLAGFENIQLFPTDTEIYLSANIIKGYSAWK